MRKSPDDATARVHLGEALKLKGRLEEAIEQFHVAVEKKSNTGRYRRLGNAYDDLGDKVEAVRYLKRAIDLEPANRKAHNGIGCVYGGMGETGKAIRHFLTSIELQPTNADARYNLATAYRTIGMMEKAAEQFEAAGKISRSRSYF